VPDVVEDEAKVITLTGSDPDGDVLTYVIAAQPAHGTVTISGDRVTYTPSLNYNGADSFTFKAVDSEGAQSDVAEVNITIAPVNDAPVLSPIAKQYVLKNKTLTINLAAFASDPESDKLIYSFTPDLSGAQIDQNRGVFTFTPSQSGLYSVTFTVQDPSGLSASRNVDIRVRSRIAIVSPRSRYVKKTDLLSGDILAVQYNEDDNTALQVKAVSLAAGPVEPFPEEEYELTDSSLKVFELDATSPTVTITSHSNGQNVSSANIILSGKVTDAGSGILSVMVDNIRASVSGDTFSAPLTLPAGTSYIDVTAEDKAGNVSSTGISLTYALPAAQEEDEPDNVQPYLGGAIIIDREGASTSSSGSTVTQPAIPAVNQPGSSAVSMPIWQEAPRANEPNYRQPSMEDNYPAYSQPASIPSQSRVVTQKPSQPPDIAHQKNKLEPAVPKEALPQELRVTAKEISRFLFWKKYQLELSGANPVFWKLTPGEKAPFGVSISGKKGIVNVFSWSKQKIKLRLTALTDEGEEKEVGCVLNIK
jgi:hypothetical protein